MRELVFEQIRAVAQEQGKQLAPLRDELPLLESGLDSLCFAILVTRLEDLSGADPFSAAEPVAFPQTLGELIAIYDRVRA